MNAKTNNIRIGVFVLAAVALFAAGLLAFGLRSLLETTVPFETAIVGEVYGLSVGSKVELRGVPVGKVTAIDFSWNIYLESRSRMVIVEFEVGPGVLPRRPGIPHKEVLEQAVKMGLRAMIKSQGVTGTSSLGLETLNPDLYPPPPIDFTPRHNYIPSAPGQITRVLESIERSLRHIEELNFAGIGEGVTNTLAHLTRLTDKLNEIDPLALSTNADGVLIEVKDTTAKLKSAVDEVRETIKGMKLESVGQNAGGLLAGFRESNAKLRVVLEKLSAAPLTDTVADLRDAVQTLDGVLQALKQYPSGFLLGKPPLPARSVQTPAK